MLDWRPYHHRNARRLFLLLSIGVGVVAAGIDLAFTRGVDRAALTPSINVTLTVVPFLLVAAFLLAAQLVPRWRGPRSLVIQAEAGRPAFAAVRSFAILSFIAILVFWVLTFLERALDGRDLGDVPGVLWFVVVVNGLFCLTIGLFLWQNTARRVILTATGLIVRRGLRTRTFGWQQIAHGGPKTPSHHSVAIMLWVTGPTSAGAGGVQPAGQAPVGQPGPARPRHPDLRAGPDPARADRIGRRAGPPDERARPGPLPATPDQPRSQRPALSRARTVRACTP